jgi:nucleoside-diphosphate-sugar epimerase
MRLDTQHPAAVGFTVASCQYSRLPVLSFLISICRANYRGTGNLLQLASSMSQLRAFVHTSTYFVLNHVPRGSVAKEEIHRLPLAFSNGSSSSRSSSSSGSTFDDAGNSRINSSSSSGGSLEHAEYVAALLEMEPEQAEAEAAYLMQKLNFNSNYAFGKFLTELQVADSSIAAGVSRAVVRPSLIAPVAMDPYPG